MFRPLLSEKRTKTVFALALLVTFVLAGLGLFCFNGAFSHLAKQRVPVPLTIRATDSEGEVLLFSDEESIFSSLPSRAKELIFTNHGSQEMNLVLPAPFSPLSLAPGEEKRLLLPEGGSLSFFATEQNGSVTYFVSDADSLKAALTCEDKGCDVVFLNNIRCEEPIEFSLPCRIDAGNYALEGGLQFSSQEKGELILLSQRSGALLLYAQAPRTKITATDGIFPFSQEVEDFYLKTESVNGRALNANRYPVDSEAMLAELAQRSSFIKESDAVIDLLPGISLSRDLSFDGAFSLHFQDEPEFNGYSLFFATQEEKEIGITTQAPLDSTHLKINAPNAHVVWNGVSSPEIEVLCETVQAATINRMDPADYRLGGDARAQILSFTAHHEDFTRPIRYTLEENLLIGTMDYLDNAFDLENASLKFQCADGTLQLETATVHADGTVDLTRRTTVILTDSHGRKSRYAVKTQREYKDLPVIEIMTEDRKAVESKTEYLNATVSIHSNGTEFDSLDATQVQIRGRGNSTWKWEKKPYKLKFREDISLFGLAPSNEWTLLANYADKSLMRNRLAYEMSKLLRFDYSPTQYCADVFLNGEYQGVYTFGEHLEAAEGRISLDQSFTPEKTGYLIEIGGVNAQIHKKGVDYFHAGTLRFALVKSPGQGELSSSQFDYISSYLIAADEAVTSGGNWRDYLDEETLIDWILLMELTNNTDCAYRRSCYYVKNADTKLMMGPVWDFDLAFGNFNRDARNYDRWATTTDDDYVGVTWTAHLLQDRAFINALFQRWNEIRDPLLARAAEVIEETGAQLAPSAEENFKHWDVLDIRTEMQRSDVTNYDTHQEQLDYLSRFLSRRAAWLDKELTRLHEGGTYEIPVIEEEK